MSGNDLVSSVLFGSQGDRCNESTFLDALYELVHVFVHSHLKRVIREFIDKLDRNVVDLGKSSFTDFFVILEEFIVRRKA